MENKTPSATNADSQKQKEIQPYVYEAEVYKDSPLRRHLEEEMAKQEVLRTKLLHAEETSRQTIQLLNFIRQQMNHTLIIK